MCSSGDATDCWTIKCTHVLVYHTKVCLHRCLYRHTPDLVWVHMGQIERRQATCPDMHYIPPNGKQVALQVKVRVLFAVVDMVYSEGEADYSGPFA